MRRLSLGLALMVLSLIVISCEKKAENSIIGSSTMDSMLEGKKNPAGYLYLDYYGACRNDTQIQVDLLPGDPNNIITQKGGNTVDVAILSSDLIIWSLKWSGIYYTIYFRGEYVDLTSITLTFQTPTGPVTVPALGGQSGLARHRYTDINDDYRNDLLVSFPKSSFSGSGTATLNCRWSLEHSDCNGLMIGQVAYTVQ